LFKYKNRDNYIIIIVRYSAQHYHKHQTCGWWGMWVMGHVGDGACGWWGMWVMGMWVMGHVGDGARGWWGTWVMGHVGDGACTWWGMCVMGACDLWVLILPPSGKQCFVVCPPWWLGNNVSWLVHFGKYS
jgi:hypothetical protein